jgi:iron complex transport system ATP-binding protein
VTDVVIDVRDLLVRRAGRAILGPLDWTVRGGERWVILGPNGSGKTTLLSVIGLELWSTAGTVDVLGDATAGSIARASAARPRGRDRRCSART